MFQYLLNLLHCVSIIQAFRLYHAQQGKIVITGIDVYKIPQKFCNYCIATFNMPKNSAESSSILEYV